MAFTDWRSDAVLLDRTLKKLADLGFTVTNVEDQPLHATRKLKREPPHDYTVILAFPERYPLYDVRPHLQSTELLKEYIQRPVKHLAPSFLKFFRDQFEKGVLEVCIRGPWNTEDYTDPGKAYEAALEWVRDYALGKDFPDDFDFPEATFFVPEAPEDFFVDSFFLEQPYIRPGSESFGTFKIVLGGNPLIGVLTSVCDLAGRSTTEAGLSIPTVYELPMAESFCMNIMREKGKAEISGFWQWCDVPPSRLSMNQALFTIKPALADYARKELVKPKQGMFLVGFFFIIFGKPACMFMLAPTDKPTLDATLNTPFYIKPHIISRQEMYARHGRSLDLAKLKETRIALLGVGALGSQAGLFLGRMGFDHFVVIDPQNLVVGNIMRHSAFLSDVGEKKVDAVRRQIGAVNPYAEVISIAEDVTQIGFDFSTLNNSLVVSTIANDRTEQFVNQRLCEMGLTAVYGRTTTTSYACRVIKVRPGADACLKCLEFYSKFKDHRYVQLEDEEISREDLVFQGCTAPSFLGANLDIGSYAQLVARVAFLATGAGDQRWFPVLNGNHFIFASRVVASEPKLMEPFTLREEFFAPLHGCPHCGQNGLPYRCVVVAKEALDKMRMLSLDANGTETGGVLVGTVATFEDNERALVIAHATKPGPRAVHKPTYFDRDKTYCGDLVRQYHAATSGDLNYVGEWHSHPSKDTRPSPLDNASLYEVVRNPGYKISSPVSIIQSAVDPTNARATIYLTNGTQYDEYLIVAPFAELKKLFPKLVEDLDSYAVVAPKEDSLWQRKKRSLLSTLKQLWI